MPLITFLNQVLGPKDLFGVMTTVQRPQDLILGQQTLMIEEQLTKYWDWGRGARVLEDDEDLMLESCFPGKAGELIARRRMDEVFSDLEGLSTLLSDLREERKNILLVSNGWVQPPSSRRLTEAIPPRMPGIGVTTEGKLTAGSTRRGEVEERWCQGQLQRLSSIDFQQRQRDLLALARRSNVTFYSLRPIGLAAPATVEGLRADREQTDSLIELSQNTDGVAVVNTNDLTVGARRIADDLSAAYVLGYYPTNTKSDGRIRRITVRLKATKAAVRARSEYRAPTEEEMASMRAATRAADAPPAVSASEGALAELKRLRPAAVLHTRGTVVADTLVLTTELTAPEVESGRWKSGGDVQVMVSGSGGASVAATRARIEPGARAAVVRIPLDKAPGPFNAAIRVRNETTGGEGQDSITVARRTSVFGDPMILRSPMPAVMKPAASVYSAAPNTCRSAGPLPRPSTRLRHASSVVTE